MPQLRVPEKGYELLKGWIGIFVRDVRGGTVGKDVDARCFCGFGVVGGVPGQRDVSTLRKFDDAWDIVGIRDCVSTACAPRKNDQK